jgi:arsenate reductase
VTQTTVLRVLILCTGNSARSQIAEALLARKGAGRIHADSAGSKPAARVNPYAVRVLAEHGIAWEGRKPKGIDAAIGVPWDVVITVCDNAREACPVFPGSTVMAHWGMPDPAEVDGGDDDKLQAFRETLAVLNGRIDRLLALPLATMDARERRDRIRAIGEVDT